MSNKISFALGSFLAISLLYMAHAYSGQPADFDSIFGVSVKGWPWWFWLVPICIIYFIHDFYSDKEKAKNTSTRPTCTNRPGDERMLKGSLEAAKRDAKRDAEQYAERHLAGHQPKEPINGIGKPPTGGSGVKPPSQ